MSHLPERKEKNCLNCNAELVGKYCHFCGQENREPVETTWHLVKHFFYDLAHFDGKFFHTLKYLIVRPGSVPKEYMMGKRNSLLDPIRMYLFTSALFFLVFFSSFDLETNFNDDLTYTHKGIDYTRIYKIEDSLDFAKETALINKGVPLTREQYQVVFDSIRTIEDAEGFNDVKFKTRSEYDSALKEGLEHGWFKRMIVYKTIDLNRKYKNNSTSIFKALFDQFLHLFPQLLFVSLPLYALILKLLYIRRRFLYTHHIIFSLYFYILSFIGMTVLVGIGKLREITGYGAFNILTGLLLVYFFIYELMALRNFYGQSVGKTIAKYILIQFLRMIMFAILLVIFFILSFLQV